MGTEHWREDARAPWTVQKLARRAKRLVSGHQRVLIGIAGPPGAGKSTLASAVVEQLGAHGVLLAMDGFHLADAELRRLGRLQRKGAIDTFDAGGYVHLLHRLLDRTEPIVYAPTFAREQEQAIAGSVPLPREVPVVVTEGNYLLADGPFKGVRPLLTESWYVDLDDATRVDRLVARHERHGRSPIQARDWAQCIDQRNADLIQTTRDRADLVIAFARPDETSDAP
jgi:pantothenate kinase